MKQSGYTPCACRDCFDIAVSNDMARPDLCHECEEAGCEAGVACACSRLDAYGLDEESEADNG